MSGNKRKETLADFVYSKKCFLEPKNMIFLKNVHLLGGSYMKLLQWVNIVHLFKW